MPTQIYGTRKTVWVALPTFGALKYGFRTNVDADTSTALGHTEIAGGTYPAGFALGVNMPKPPRASKTSDATGITESSWCAPASVATARVAGWTVRSGKLRIGQSGKRSKTCYIIVDGVKFAWRMPNYQHTLINANFADLGIYAATNADDELVFGASYPKLPRASAIITGQGRVSTFVDPTKLDNLPAGWTGVGGGTRNFI